MGTRMACALTVYFIMLSSLAFANSDDVHLKAAPPANINEKFFAYDFLDWSQLSSEQTSLLAPFLSSLSSHTSHESRGETPQETVPFPDMFKQWSMDANHIAATFLAISRSLSVMSVRLPDGSWIRGIDMVVAINSLEGDRIKVRFNPTLFQLWKQEGGDFKFQLANGSDETGRFNFSAGDQVGGSLHPGYDIQGFSSNTKVPRMQINYRDSDSEADIDLDGYQPFKWGVIPNPHHLTYENSDVRYWISNYFKKFGNPGFKVKVMK